MRTFYIVIQAISHMCLLSHRIFIWGPSHYSPLRKLIYYSQIIFLASTIYWILALLKTIPSLPSQKKVYFWICKLCDIFYQLSLLFGLAFSFFFWIQFHRKQNLVWKPTMPYNFLYEFIFAGSAPIFLLLDFRLGEHNLYTEYYEDVGMISGVVGGFIMLIILHKHLYRGTIYHFQGRMGFFTQFGFYIGTIVLISLMDYLYRFLLYDHILCRSKYKLDKLKPKQN